MAQKINLDTRKETINTIAIETKQTAIVVKQILDAYEQYLENQLITNGGVKLGNIGRFKISISKARTGVNPSNKKSINIPAKANPKFTFGKAIKELVADKIKPNDPRFNK